MKHRLLDAEDADDRRVEVEGLGSKLCEAGGVEQVGDLAGRLGRGLPHSAGLGRDGNASPGREPPAQVFEPLDRCRPEPDGVHRKDGIEGAVESWRQVFDGAQSERDSSGPDGGGVASARLSEHYDGVIDAIDVTGGANSPVQLGNGEAWAEANLQDAIARLHVEQSGDPTVALAVGETMRHHPASYIADRASWP